MAADHPPPVRKSVVPPHHYPNWKPFTGKHQIEYVADTDSRRRRRNDRRKSLFRRSHELAVISGGHVFTMYIDDNGQTWIYTNSEAMWKTYRTIGLKQGPLEKRCDENLKVIDVSDASIKETKFSGAAPPPSEPSENVEHILLPAEIKIEPMFSSEDVAIEVDSLTDYSEGSDTQRLEDGIVFPDSQSDNLAQPTIIVKNEYQMPVEQVQPKSEVVSRPMAALRGPSLQSPTEELSKPRAGQKRQIEPQGKYRIEGSSCEDCAQGFPDKKKLILHLSCHKAVGQGPRGQLSSSSKKKPP